MGIDTLQAILYSHFARYPQMQARDLYKLLHQAALGSEHAVKDEDAARLLLSRELAEMATGPDDPLLDPISPDGSIVRIHLRPYIIAGWDPETLLQAFMRTANEWRGSVETLREYGQSAADLAEKGLLSLSAQEVSAFFAEMEAQGFPAAHHSEVYGRLYHPAYRVVAHKFLE
jgi:hypothetical protein